MGSAVRVHLDEPLGRQPGQCLADRGARDAEPLGELHLTEVGAGGELARAGSPPQRCLGTLGGTDAPAAPPSRVVCNVG